MHRSACSIFPAPPLAIACSAHAGEEVIDSSAGNVVSRKRRLAAIRPALTCPGAVTAAWGSGCLSSLYALPQMAAVSVSRVRGRHGIRKLMLGTPSVDLSTSLGGATVEAVSG